MAKIWCSRTVRQIDRQIDIKIGYPETYRLNGIDMVLSDRQIDRYQNQISRNKQIEWQRYGVLRHQIDSQIDRYQNWISRDKQIEWHRYGTLRQIDRIDRYQNQISRDKQIEWQTYGVLRQSDRQIDRQIDIKIGYPETNRLNGIDMVLSDRQIEGYQNQISKDKQIEWHRYGSLRQIDRQISKLDIQRQTD